MIRLSNKNKQLIGEVRLPSSKSITNRMLILKKLYEHELILDNVSLANDSMVLDKLLNSNDNQFDVQDAGTVYRFLTAYCAVTPGEWIIRGTKRLQERPIADLISVLRDLGADITYLEKEGCGPIKVIGKKLIANASLIDISQIKSSQFASALLMIAPMIEGEFNFKVNTKMSSYSYILLTIACLRRMGFSVWVRGAHIQVSKKQKFDGEYFQIEPDWSSFYYWISMIHLSERSDIFFPGIRLNNMQKERKKLFEIGHPSLVMEEQNEGMRIVKHPSNEKYVFPDELNYSQFPDIAMTFAMLLPAIGCEQIKFKGLHSLKYKECNREQATIEHLTKIGVDLKSHDNLWLMDASNYELKNDTLFNTYHDHRMAMCVAPLSLIKPIRIEEDSVVKKSYPNFWKDLENIGFEIEYL